MRPVAGWILIFLLALTVRLTVLELRPRETNQDETTYVLLAEHLARGEGFTRGSSAETHVAPLFPVLHAAVILSGVDPRSAGIGLALIVGSLLPVVTGLLFARVLGSAPGIAAALAVTLHPFLASFSRWIQPESLAALLVIGFVLLWHRGALRSAGVVLALGYLARPEVLLLLPVWAAVVLADRKVPRRRMLIAIGCCIVVTLPYLIYLWSATGRFCITGKDVWVYINGIAQVETGNQPVSPAILSRLEQEVPGVAWHILTHPLSFLSGYAVRWGYMLRNLVSLILWPLVPLPPRRVMLCSTWCRVATRSARWPDSIAAR